MATPGPAKRLPAKSNAAPSAAGDAALLALAVAAGVWLLVARGRMAWPPRALLADAYTVAGCLGLCGPLVLARRGRADWALGDLLWMTGGMLLWLHDLAAVLDGRFRFAAAPTPLPAPELGLAVAAVLVAGGRLQGAGRAWSWTNVLGWLLGLFWIGMGLTAIAAGPARPR